VLWRRVRHACTLPIGAGCATEQLIRSGTRGSESIVLDDGRAGPSLRVAAGAFGFRTFTQSAHGSDRYGLSRRLATMPSASSALHVGRWFRRRIEVFASERRPALGLMLTTRR
jgi:hypothetical protein